MRQSQDDPNRVKRLRRRASSLQSGVLMLPLPLEAIVTCASLQSRELPPHARDSRVDCGVVADKSSREADQDRCQGRQSRSLRHIPDGRGRNPTAVIRRDHAENRRFAIAADGNGNMSTPVTVRGKTTGRCALMGLQQVYSSPSGQFGYRLPATAPVQAADDLLRRRGPSTSDRIRLPYGESRLI